LNVENLEGHFSDSLGLVYVLALAGCIGAFVQVLSRPQHVYLVAFPLIVMFARFFLYCVGVLQKDDGFKFVLYGLEYCSAGEFAARLGGPTRLCLMVMALGMVLLILQFLTGPKPRRFARPKPV
jgi:hypothetical protein